MAPATESYLRDIGPQDVDSGGNLVSKVGVHNQGRKLILDVAASRPRELTTIQQWPEDFNRTRYLDPTETEKKVLSSDAAIEDSKFISARVHGRNRDEDQKVVVALLEAPSGRTYRAAVPYEDFTKSQKAYANAVEGGSVVQGPTDAAASQQIEALSAEVANLRRELATKNREATPPATPDRGGSEAGAKLVDQNANDVKDDLADASDADLAAALEAEKAGKDRVTVVEAIEAEQSSRASS